MRHRQLLATLASISLLPLIASAQGILQRFAGLGDVVAGVGDLDGDGHPEVLVGLTGRFGHAGEVQLVSVLDGSTLRAHSGSAVDDGFATATAALGDIDNDGVGDYAISTTGGAAPGVRIHSGASGLVLRTIVPPAGTGAFGTILNAEGDIDADQVRDLLITSAPTTAGALPAVWVYSGQSGALLRTHFGASAQDLDFGCALSIIGDVDGDGSDDYAIDNSRRHSTRKGEVQVLSGASGALRYTLNRPGIIWDDFGTSISAAHDADGDGHADLLVGSPSESYVVFSSGMIHLYSGFDGHMLVRIYSPLDLLGTLEFGQSVLGIDDYDGDGIDDILGFSPAVLHGDVIRNENRVFIFSGRTGAMLEWVYGLWPMSEYGGNGPVVSAGDLNSDGHDDWLIASPGFSTQATAVMRNAPVPLASVYWPISCSNGAANSLACYPLLAWSSASSLSIGEEPRVTATKLMPNTIGLMLWSSSQASLPFGSGQLCVGAPVRRTAATSTGGINGFCTGSLTFTFPRSLLLSHGLVAGSELVVQAWCRDPGFPPPQDRSLTMAVAFTLWP